MPKKFLSEYEAACLTGMSPDLLRWLTVNAPKSGVPRKLKVADKKGEALFFEEVEVIGFNQWLKAPWPHKPGKRPHVPAGIRREIKQEANGACAICHGHQDSCEAAHLDPVYKSKNNHPENLLWLCSNHHTAYDNGLFGPDEENAEFVGSFKKILHRYKLLLWRTQHEISSTLLTVLEDCSALAKQLAEAKTGEQVKAVARIAESTLERLPALAPVSKQDPKYEAFKSISAEVASLSKDESPIATRLEKARSIRKDYVAAFGFVVCPLCEGSGRHKGTDCPVCGGDREIEEKFVDRIDLRDYEKVDCPLCEGEDTFRGEPCPVCGGEARMDRRYADLVDLGDYEKIHCPLCGGSQTYEGELCPVCGGEGELDRRHADAVDLREFELVDCPLCGGAGRVEGNDCPGCGGRREMQRRFANRIDLGDYAKVDCPVCSGEGIRTGGECPICGGAGQVARGDLERIDVKDYELIECPICEGKGHCDDGDCRACGGGGEIERRCAENIDPRDHRG
ncbi:HNH endonuclease [Bradyrhizobium viridifuturi]|uniref:HNH endonuclease n=1 Tax=Bradyrhizobium viridifuturi TaxID=1654716 RepID=UPI00067F4C80|nr:HNH endonuclease [Bradyrhizobium viridifuturi]